jgi:hypothetical protein
MSFISRQKGFVHEAGCFNDVHIPNEVMRLAKKSKGLVAVQQNSRVHKGGDGYL